MSITYIFTCDRCGHEDTAYSDDVFMSVRDQKTYLHIKTEDHDEREEHLCQDCYDVAGEEAA